MEFKRDEENQGNTERRGSLLDRIAAEVIAKYPNGNLLLEARKVRQVNQETETITLRGIVRPLDIARDNTVRSDRILRREVHYDGDGPVNLAQRQGWFARALNYLWPF